LARCVELGTEFAEEVCGETCCQGLKTADICIMTFLESSRYEHRISLVLLLLRHASLIYVLFFATSRRKDVVPHTQLQPVHQRLTEATPTAI